MNSIATAEKQPTTAPDVIVKPGTICVTGHRPSKLGGYSDEVSTALTSFAIMELRKRKPGVVVIGMALGWDQAVAQACCFLDIMFIAAVPFIGQEFAWPNESKQRYQDLLKKAFEVVVIEEGGYAAWKMHSRNSWMVRNSQRVLALWDGSSGGTANCVHYARAIGRPVDNCWNEWKAFRWAV